MTLRIRLSFYNVNLSFCNIQAKKLMSETQIIIDELLLQTNFAFDVFEFSNRQNEFL